MFWRIADFSKFYLANALKQPGLSFFEKIFNLKRLQQGWQRCVGQAKGFFAPAIAAMLARKEPIRDSEKIETIIALIRTEILSFISELKGLTEVESRYLLKEIADIEVISSYPSQYFNDTILEQLYASAEVLDGQYYESVLKLENYRSRIYGQRISQSVAETRWSTYLDESFDKSIYSDSKHFIFVQPTELQYPYYNSQLPDYVNFAGLGSRISLLYGLALNYKVSCLTLRTLF